MTATCESAILAEKLTAAAAARQHARRGATHASGRPVQLSAITGTNHPAGTSDEQAHVPAAGQDRATCRW
jgi:hypothetical protein